MSITGNLLRKTVATIAAASIAATGFAQSSTSGNSGNSAGAPKISADHFKGTDLTDNVSNRKPIRNFSEAVNPKLQDVLGPAIINNDDFVRAFNIVVQNKGRAPLSASQLSAVVRGLHLDDLAATVRVAANLTPSAVIETEATGALLFGLLISKEGRYAAAATVLTAAAAICTLMIIASPNKAVTRQLGEEFVKVLGTPIVIAAGIIAFPVCVSSGCHAFTTPGTESAESTEDNCRDESRNIESVRGRYFNVINDHLTPLDLSAAKRELSGEVVAKRADGTPFSHVSEVCEAQNSLRNSVGTLNNILSISKLCLENRADAEDLLAQISRMLDYTEGFVPTSACE